MRIAVVTTGRQDLGILRSTIEALNSDNDFELLIWAGGMHSSPRFGKPYEAVSREGWPVPRKLEFLSEPPDPTEDAARAMIAVGEAVDEEAPNSVLLVGDRHETLAVAMASVLRGVPVAHLHGGEESEGSLDNLFRHAITKLSHIHLVSHEDHARRVIQMGEDPSTVQVVGAPGLDNAYRDDLLERDDLETALGATMAEPLVLVTIHPATSSPDPLLAEAESVLSALEGIDGTFVVTLPNADGGGADISSFIRERTELDDRFVVVPQLGERLYWSMLKVAACVVGNSSSGILEAPSVGVPSVSVGTRQRGRLAHPSVRFVPAEVEAVRQALDEALESARGDDESRAVFPPGPAAPRIVAALKDWAYPSRLVKVFHDE